MIILIPAYEPDAKLISLLRSIRDAAPSVDVVLVDDGSGADHASVFATAGDLGCLVLTHAGNRGKGAALRTGFAWIARHRPGSVVVCADCDGQHTVRDILRVADATTASIAVGHPSI
ncbi:MAG TPA: glycosyltransferase, partial [Propionibacteriaceae bacterium]|nr:glycosyltransferase [Propionibacteriaceae bacterium]